MSSRKNRKKAGVITSRADRKRKYEKPRILEEQKLETLYLAWCDKNPSPFCHAQTKIT